MKLRRVSTVLAATLLAWSCSDPSRSPVTPTGMATDTDVLQSATRGPVSGTIVFTPRALRAAKLGVVENNHGMGEDSAWMSEADGGELEVAFERYVEGAEIQVEEAEFEVVERSIEPVLPSLNGSHLVSMRVTTGTSLDDVAVTFWPSGMKFNPGAELRVKFRGYVGAAGLVGYHISADGQVTRVDTEVVNRKGTFTVKITVPGFSEYSWDDEDGYDVSDEDPTMDDGSCWGC